MSINSTGEKITYEQFTQNLNNSGVRTTQMYNDAEANFADYGNALSDSLKQQILDSFDNEQDYALQQKIAGFFTNRNDLTHGNFMASCQAMGLSISCEYQNTSYIVDNKFDNNFHKSAINGAVAVYTISDGKGGEIKIVDANGNGSIESEELFMNQILGDINYDIGQITPAAVSSGSSGVNGSNGTSLNTNDKEKVSQDDFNSEVEKYISQGFSISASELKANLSLKSLNLSYTGNMKEEDSSSTDTSNISQNDFNSEIEQEVNNGLNLNQAISKVKLDLNVYNKNYTGFLKEKDSKSKEKENISQNDYNNEIESKLHNGIGAKKAIENTKKEMNVFNMSYTGFLNDLLKEDKKEKENNIFI